MVVVTDPGYRTKQSSSNVSYLDPVCGRTTEAQLACKIDVGCNGTYRAETPVLAPFFQPFQSDRVQSDRVPARVQSRVVHGLIGLRLRAACILPDEAVHQIKNDLFRDERIGISFGETFRAEPRALRKPPPVIDVRD